MSPVTEHSIAGSHGAVVVSEWRNPGARHVVLLAHGYGEHAGRYEHVAEHLVADGATVYAPDHLGHGRSEGERALLADMDAPVDDLGLVAQLARDAHPGLPVVLIGHSMGGMIATRYAQRHADELAALVLSGPVIGGNPDIEALAQMDPIPEVPIDPAVLSRDPAVGEAYAADPLVYHGPFRRETLLAFGAAVEAIAAGPALDGLPTLWLHGEHDALAPLAQTQEAIARIGGDRLEQKVYPGAQHEIFNETNKDEVLSDVTAFLHRALG